MIFPLFLPLPGTGIKSNSLCLGEKGDNDYNIIKVFSLALVPLYYCPFLFFTTLYHCSFCKRVMIAINNEKGLKVKGNKCIEDINTLQWPMAR
jgi:hypothetical protein